MYDFSKQIRNFHTQHVTLTRVLQDDMKGRRDRNRDRIKSGLKELGKPAPANDWINQGGYAQKTMTQPPEGDEDSRYDIDMGVVFEVDDAKTSETTKGWVCDALAKKATNVKNDPEIKPKCIRVVYANGYQCDFPVFQRTVNANGYDYQLAAGREWIDSDPRAMNAWIEEQVIEKSPQDSGTNQLRHVIRFIKYFAKVHAYRKSRKFPGGLVATALAIECYEPVEGRDDEAIYETLKRLSRRSEYQTVIANGIEVSDQKDIDRLARLIDVAGEAVDALEPLARDDEGLTDEDAKKAWKKVFRHSFFNKAKTKAAAMVAGLATLSAEEKLGRAEAAVAEIRETGRGAKPWLPLRVH